MFGLFGKKQAAPSRVEQLRAQLLQLRRNAEAFGWSPADRRQMALLQNQLKLELAKK